jgi:hypothetical protein
MSEFQIIDYISNFCVSKDIPQPEINLVSRQKGWVASVKSITVEYNSAASDLERTLSLYLHIHQRN